MTITVSNWLVLLLSTKFWRHENLDQMLLIGIRDNVAQIEDYHWCSLGLFWSIISTHFTKNCQSLNYFWHMLAEQYLSWLFSSYKEQNIISHFQKSMTEWQTLNTLDDVSTFQQHGCLQLFSVPISQGK